MRRIKFLAVIALIAIAGFLWVACDSSSDDSGTTSDGNTVSGWQGSGSTVTKKGDLTVNEKYIPDINKPVSNETPVVFISSSQQYEGIITWFQWTGSNPPPQMSDATFQKGETYIAVITLQAKKGYTFNGVAANSFIVDGGDAENDANSNIIQVVFEPTDDALPISTPISLSVPQPVKFGTPPTTVPAGAQYRGGSISWAPDLSLTNGVFGPGEVYTATIVLQPKSGYSFGNVPANSIDNSGVGTATNSAGSGTVSVVFPATASETISQLTINGVVPPAVSSPMQVATALQEANAHGQYTLTIAWKKNSSTPAAGGSSALTDSFFLPSQFYALEITAAAATGYNWPTPANPAFVVAGISAPNTVAVTAVDATTYKITVEFTTQLAATEITSLSLNIAKPVPGQVKTGWVKPIAGFASPTITWGVDASGTPDAGASTVGNPFLGGGVAYKVTIALGSITSGYTNGLTPASSITLVGLTAGTDYNILNPTGNPLSSFDVVFNPTQAVYSGNLAIGGLTVPVAGATPVTSITPVSGKYAGTVTWTGVDGDNKFGLAQTPTATVLVTWLDSTTTPAGADFTCTGATGGPFHTSGPIVSGDNAGKYTFTIPFPTTAAVVPSAGLDIDTSFAMPTDGTTVVSKATFVGDTYFEPATVSWVQVGSTGGETTLSLSDSFAEATPGNVYRATVNLVCKTGYTFYSLAINGYTFESGTSKTSSISATKISNNEVRVVITYIPLTP